MGNETFINRFIPSHLLDNADLYRQSKLIVQLSFFIAGAAILFAGIYYVLDFIPGSIALLLGLVGAVINLIVFQKLGSKTVAGNILLLMMLSILTFLSVNIGGIEASSLPWLIAIPLLSVLLLGKGWVWVWTIFVELDILILYILEQTGYQLPQCLSAQGERFTHFSGLSALVLVILAITILFQKSSSKPLQESRQKAESVADHLKSIFNEVDNSAAILFSASSGLSAVSKKMFVSVEQTFDKVKNATTSAQEILTDMDAMTDIMDQASANMESAVSAAEEMTSTISNISQNTDKARQSTEKAVLEAKSASENVEELGKAATDIGKVTAAISDISSQTNLLALNATIEAARAGDVGKGFAVVANEIKELAQQTESATDEIKNRVEEIQKSTMGTVSQIEQISKVIYEVNEIVAALAEAVNKQSEVTKKIAENIGLTSRGTQDVNHKVTQNFTSTEKIVAFFEELNNGSKEMSDNSAQVDQSAEELLSLAKQLKEGVMKNADY